MNTIIDNFLLPLFVIICVLYAFTSLGYASITLTKAYHHIAQHPDYLERATISLYFSDNPTVQIETENTTTVSFFLPNVFIAQGECQTMVESLNARHNGYTISLKEVVKPKKGINISFCVQPEKCLLQYETFDSISLQKGMIFRIYDKELLCTLERTPEKPILRAACNTCNDIDDKVPLRVVIDPGHGGYDPGARVIVNGCSICEKDICLAIALQVSDALCSKGITTRLTRENDTFCALDQRTRYAHDNHADIFISIHANYAHNSSVHGIETFCMHPTLITRHFSQLSDIHNTHVMARMNKRCSQSLKIAQSVQSHVCSTVAPFHDALVSDINRKVKHSVCQVLLGNQMPAILIEVGFLSHKTEVMLLSSVTYQRCIAQGICDGILAAIF